MIPSQKVLPHRANETCYDRLVTLLSKDLDFHGEKSGYASHNFHSFPAKFPPQLPQMVITNLTQPGDVVLDPMAGSGTAILEAFLSRRSGIGFDIDPLAILISKVKVTPLDAKQVEDVGIGIIKQAQLSVRSRSDELRGVLDRRWDHKTRNFIDHWFAPQTQIELLALITEIENIPNESIREFLKVTFSSLIITKSGGVSLAFDLAHTRPHLAKVVIDQSGNIILGDNLVDNPSRRIKILTKTLRPTFKEFEKRLSQNLGGLLNPSLGKIRPCIGYGNAQALPLRDSSVDLIVTSPPYASNAIDYMRAHKFSLVWMGNTIGDLSQKRKDYIGGEVLTRIDFEDLPNFTSILVAEISNIDEKKGRILHRYYSEMTRTLREMFRVLKPGKVAIVIVGSSMMRGKDTKTQNFLVDIGQSIGFEVPKIGVRNLDRNRRMLPAGSKINLGSQIQQRMHKEYVIGFYKPESRGIR